MDWNASPAVYPPHLRSRVRRGFGIGIGPDYRSWCQIKGSGGKGTSAYVRGIKVDRIYQLLSEKETTYFYLLERSRSIIDIREHWPILDLDRTLQLSRQCGVHHPFRNGAPEPFTLDFLVTELTDKGLTYRAANLSPTVANLHDRSGQLLYVQYLWCIENGVPWFRVDTSQFDRKVLQNLRYIRSWFLHQYRSDDELAESYAETFLACYERNVPLQSLLVASRQRLHLTDTAALDTFLYCAWSERIPVSLTHRLALSAPVVLDDGYNHG
ncbi:MULTISPECIES: TnsA endonuclease N-terminal domain-containing protein [Burkholderia]|uniref:TnsA endonuclease N-terminal domain-containing protein n=1 Tax=Burkholderia TaxID=32008 RepID=UPI0019161B79|nr:MULTISPECIES: TnsA endonuclease N-terminal domain-containing protein [Burkholderia]ELK7724558.1 TnsA endonuclease N-terminal domain-containing protein [Burkholderia cenocepacia]MBL3965728.1 TnsA endonuclease N-terminal domain-containing protein [Burkholderia sp. KCJ3K979]